MQGFGITARIAQYRAPPCDPMRVRRACLKRCCNGLPKCVTTLAGKPRDDGLSDSPTRSRGRPLGNRHLHQAALRWRYRCRPRCGAIVPRGAARRATQADRWSSHRTPRQNRACTSRRLNSTCASMKACRAQMIVPARAMPGLSLWPLGPMRLARGTSHVRPDACPGWQPGACRSLRTRMRKFAASNAADGSRLRSSRPHRCRI
ncbi:hypothetical protein AWB78_08315 [Caballeronia calidae]|uniref:Uncharacterized protein n=1 Tax=Caballeronia calidae TaxID=1777139 RepID=A0A158EJC8_9BURK|nr:hypothetical protein AWB78_08315 [Caballeronia calidae]